MFDLHPECRGGGKDEAFEQRLLAADWEDALGALRLNGNLRAEELAEAALPKNVRVFLRLLLEEDGTRATPAGYLNKKFLMRLCKEMTIGGIRRNIFSVGDVESERSWSDVRLTRLVAEAAGLSDRKDGRFMVTEAGRKLMGEGAEGAFYRQVFISYFRDFDWRMHPCRDRPREVQQAMAVSLWRLDNLAAEGASIENLVTRILRPEALKALQGKDKQSYKWGFSLFISFFGPLEEFDLVRLEQPGGEMTSIERHIVRVTPLWSRFMRFAPAP
jgi:hypothetical protein